MVDILILDDIKGVRRAFGRILRHRLGVRCLGAASNHQATQLLKLMSGKAQPLAFILQDYNRPEAGAGSFISDQQRYPSEAAIGGVRVCAIPTLVVSAMPDLGRLTALDPAIPVLDKPCMIDALINTIESLLAAHTERWLLELVGIGLEIDWQGGVITGPGPARIETASLLGPRAVVGETLKQINDIRLCAMG